MAGSKEAGQALSRGWFASELGLRVASALVLGIVALVATYQGGWSFALLWLAAGLAILFEWMAMVRIRPLGPTPLALGAALIVLTTPLLNVAPARYAIVVAGVLALGAVASPFAGRGVRLWAVLGFACAAVIVVVPPLVREDGRLGLVGVLWMFAVVWTTDIAAYFTGRRLGGPKLWPRVSPKKTWSGFAGGLAGGTLAGLAVVWAAARWGWTPPFGLAVLGVVSALASIASQGGDLAESALKRRFGVKDSGHLIPGHGGVMDRLDGFWTVSLALGCVLAAARLAD